MAPIPCAHCGNLFMRRDLELDAKKLCNNCAYREQQRPIKEEKSMDEIQILIKCDRKTQIEIEEICVNQGRDFSQYFLDLHRLNCLNGFEAGKSLGNSFVVAPPHETPEGLGEERYAAVIPNKKSKGAKK